jgi:hypothetical protein
MKSNPIKKSFICILILMQYITLLGQENYSLGGYNLIKSTVSTIKKTILYSGSIGTRITGGAARGVMFEQVAVPSLKLDTIDIAINFVPNPDHYGYNLSVTIQDTLYTVFLPTWQLKPIADYVDEGNELVFTYGGQYQNPDTIECLYHPAFINTLLGLRLFQSDLIFSDGFWDLPRLDNKPILAKGELKYNPDNYNYNGYSLSSIISDIGELLPNGYTSYILSDFGQEFRFNTFQDKFYITGQPYYLFSRLLYDNTDLINNVCSEFSELTKKIDIEKYKNNNALFDLQDFCLKKNGYYYLLNEYLNDLYYKEDYQSFNTDICNCLDSLKIHKNSILLEESLFIEMDSLCKSESNKEELKGSLYNLKNQLIYKFYDFEVSKNEYDYDEYFLEITDSINVFEERYPTFKDDKLETLKNILKTKPNSDNFENIDEIIDDFDYYNWYNSNESPEYRFLAQLYLIKPYDVVYDEGYKKLNSFELNEITDSTFENIYNYSKDFYAYSKDKEDFHKEELLLCGSESLRNEMHLMFLYNPAVMESVLQTARYSAFFRYVKQKYPRNWNRFVVQLKDVDPNNDSGLKGVDIYTPISLE